MGGGGYKYVAPLELGIRPREGPVGASVPWAEQEGSELMELMALSPPLGQVGNVLFFKNSKPSMLAPRRSRRRVRGPGLQGGRRRGRTIFHGLKPQLNAPASGRRRDRLIAAPWLCQVSFDGNSFDGLDIQSRRQAGAPFRGQAGCGDEPSPPRLGRQPGGMCETITH